MYLRPGFFFFLLSLTGNLFWPVAWRISLGFFRYRNCNFRRNTIFFRKLMFGWNQQIVFRVCVGAKINDSPLFSPLCSSHVLVWYFKLRETLIYPSHASLQGDHQHATFHSTMISKLRRVFCKLHEIDGWEWGFVEQLGKGKFKRRN